MILTAGLLRNNPIYNAPIQKGRKKRGFLDLFLGEFLPSESEVKNEEHNLIAFKVGVKKFAKIGKYSEKKFREEEVEDFPDSTVVWIIEHQLLLIEKSTKYNIGIDSVINSLEDHINKMLREYELVVSIILLTDKAAFWDVIKSNKEIYEIEFALVSPNFIGDFHHNISDMLQNSKDVYNARKTTYRLSNEDGYLIIPDDDVMLSDMLGWVVDGGGEWKIKTGKMGKRMPPKRSIEGPTKVDLELDEYNSKTMDNFIVRVLDYLKSLGKIEFKQGDK